MTPFTVSVLGPVEVRAAGDAIPLGGRKQRLLLVDLVINRDTSLPGDRLIFDLWGDHPPPTAAGTLSAYVSRLRKVLGTDAISRDPAGYRLRADWFEVDSDAFESDVDRARAVAGDDLEAAGELYRTALERWRGDAFGEIGYEHFARTEAERLGELRSEATEAFFSIELEQGLHREVIPGLQAAVEEWPLAERFWQLLMLALYRSGRQADALRTYRRAARVLGDELGIAPGPALTALEERILLQDPGLGYQLAMEEQRERAGDATTLRTFSTPFVGRAEWVTRIAQTVTGNQVVTLVGPGGVGKTRLAVECAWAVADRFPGGVWDVDLAVVSTAEGVLDQAATTIGVPPGPQSPASLAAHIDDKAALVLLDNCEHVVDHLQPIIESLTRACPGLKVLATSRTPLEVAQEVLVPVEPLPVPAPSDVEPRSIARTDAVALFENVGATAREGFRVTATNAGSVATIVRVLDGMPLALELAAARLALLTPDQLAAELTSGAFPALVRDSTSESRHATLRAVVDWSYDLLSERERAVLDDLSIFAGHFSAAEAAAVRIGDVDNPAELESLIRGLVGKSLVVPPVPMTDGVERYRMLDTIRLYGREQLRSTGRLRDAGDRHVRWIQTVADDVVARQHGPEQGALYRTLRAIRHEIGAALLRSADDPKTLTQLHRGLWTWWLLDGAHDEAAEELRRYVEPLEADTLDLAAAWSLAVAELGRGPDSVLPTYDDARLVAEQIVAMAADLPDRWFGAWCRLIAGDALTAAEGYESAETALRDAIAVFEVEGPDWALGWTYLRLVRVAAFLHFDFAEADDLMERAIAALQRAGDAQLLAYSQLALANRSRMMSRFPEGYELAMAATDGFREVGTDSPLYETLHFATLCAIGMGRYEVARGHGRQMAALAEARGLPGWMLNAGLLEAEILLAEGRHEEALRWLIAMDDMAEFDFLTERARRLRGEALLGLGRGKEALPLLEAIRSSSEAEAPWTRAHLTAAEIQLATGNIGGGLATLTEAATRFTVLPTPHGLANAAEAAVGAVPGDPRSDARLLGAAGQLRNECGAVPTVAQRLRSRELTTAVAMRMGPADFTAAWQEGAEVAADVGAVAEMIRQKAQIV